MHDESGYLEAISRVSYRLGVKDGYLAAEFPAAYSEDGFIAAREAGQAEGYEVLAPPIEGALCSQCGSNVMHLNEEEVQALTTATNAIYYARVCLRDHSHSLLCGANGNPWLFAGVWLWPRPCWSRTAEQSLAEIRRDFEMVRFSRCVSSLDSSSV